MAAGDAAPGARRGRGRRNGRREGGGEQGLPPHRAGGGGQGGAAQQVWRNQSGDLFKFRFFFDFHSLFLVPGLVRQNSRGSLYYAA